MKTLKIQSQILVFIVSMILSVNAYSQDPNFYIFLCFGQSNMEGQGTIEQQDRTVDSRFQVLQSVNCSGQSANAWRTATPPLCRCSNGLGPADYFGRTMVENLPSNIKIGVVHVAVAGCKIELFDKNNYASYASGVESWMKNIIAEYGGNPYGRLVELAKLAQQDGVIKGILMHQGESNTGDSQWANKVKGVYENLLADLGLNANDVPFLAGQVVDAAQGGQCASMNTQIDALPNTIPTAHAISSSGCTDQSDNLHFNSAGYRLLGERYAQKMLELLPTVPDDYPVVSITAPTATDVFTAPATITIEANATDPNGTVSLVEFFEGTSKLGEDATAPYSFEWTGVDGGKYVISAIATDNEGHKTTSSSVALTVNVPQGPYGGSPHPIPGTIEFELYDVGGSGIAYFDDTPGTEVSPDPGFRGDEDVDLEVCTDTGDGYNIGYGTAGEWVEYTVDVESTGVYNINIRVACDGDGRTIDISSNNVSLAGDIAIPNTGGWQAWETITLSDVNLTAGEQIIRVTIGATDYVNLNNMNFVAVSVAEPPVISITFPQANGTTVIGEQVTITADASSVDATIDNVEFTVKGAVVGTDNSAPYSANWTPISTGDYTISVKATDSNGLSTTTTILLTVVEASEGVSLSKGWNMIGCPLSGSTGLETALSSIWSHVEVIKDMDQYYYIQQDAFLNTLENVEWGKGYLIKVDAACELMW